MLDKTFCHIEGVSIETERLLKQNQIDCWDVFLEKYEQVTCIPLSKRERIKTELFFSKEQLENNNLNYFKSKVPVKEHWRMAHHGRIAFLDIETTGLSRWTDDITMIGIYDGEESFQYIKDINLEEAKQKLQEYDIVVTFNGKMFDLPFIEYKFNLKYDLVHLDLRFMLKEFGFSGGLKKIEQELGIDRGDISNIDGREAVRLWRRYLRGDREAMTLLLKYNQEDIRNLKFLLEYYIKRKTQE